MPGAPLWNCLLEIADPSRPGTYVNEELLVLTSAAARSTSDESGPAPWPVAAEMATMAATNITGRAMPRIRATGCRRRGSALRCTSERHPEPDCIGHSSWMPGRHVLIHLPPQREG